MLGRGVEDSVQGRRYLVDGCKEGYWSPPKSSFGGAQSSWGGLSLLTHTGEGRTASARRRSFNAVPLRKPLSVDEATP